MYHMYHDTLLNVTPSTSKEDSYEFVKKSNRVCPCQKYCIPLLLAVLVSQLGHARDRGQFASSNPEITVMAG